MTAVFVQSFFSGKESKRQIAARREEQSAQFEHDLEVSQISRRIDLQSAYLKPLQEKISDCYKLHLKMEDTLRSIRVRYGDPPDPNKNAFLMEILPDFKYAHLVNIFEESYECLEGIHSEIEIIMSRCSDVKITFLVSDFTFMTIFDLPLAIFSLKALAGLSFIPANEIEREPVSLQKIENQLSEARRRMTETHADIERILSGARETK